MDAKIILAGLKDLRLLEIEPYEHGWTFRFSGGAVITTQSIWRVLGHEGTPVTSEDHLQQFGLPKPLDARIRAMEALQGAVIQADAIPVTCDLRVRFGNGCVLEFLNTSSGDEGWHLAVQTAERNSSELVALGGGGLAIIEGN